MNNLIMHRPERQYVTVFSHQIWKGLRLMVFIVTLCIPWRQVDQAVAAGASPIPIVNVPYLGPKPPAASYTPAIMWFGQVDSSHNYADVRLDYFDSQLDVTLHIIDRWLMYDTTPSAADLTQWDSATLYLDMDGNTGGTLNSHSYRFDAEVNWFEARDQYQAAYRGNGSTWTSASIPFTSETGWRGDGVLNDNQDDKGWIVTFTISFSDLGLSGPPPQGTVWGLGLAVHDRDSVNGPPLPDTVWPTNMNPTDPASWGQIRFGIPRYNRPPALPTGTVTIREGLNGINVPDGAVGGHTVCGGSMEFWTQWGEANYAGYDQINIQNQWDISDWPCFSKYFITFPTNPIPRGQSIISATLTMYMFGTAGGGIWGTPPDSYIQALTVDRDWSETTLTWNNAPLELENFGGTWVKPMTSLDWVAVTWDVSRAVAQAYAAGAPLRLALYSADGERHTGKYFMSSDTGDYDAAGRPTLRVTYGSFCSSPGVTCTYAYLPVLTR